MNIIKIDADSDIVSRDIEVYYKGKLVEGITKIYLKIDTDIFFRGNLEQHNELR